MDLPINVEEISAPNPEHCTDIKCLYRGGQFGKLFLTKDNDSRWLLVTKEFFDQEAAWNEITLYQKLKHKRILAYYGCHVEGHATGVIPKIFLEYASQGNFRGHMRNIKTEKQTAFYASQILEGLIYLHEHGVTHGHISPESILVNVFGNIKIGSLGYANRIEYNGLRVPLYPEPPEMQQGVYSTKMDIWDFGLLTTDMAMFKVPAYVMHIGKSFGLKIPLPESYTNAFTEFVKETLLDVKNRPDARTLMSSPWITFWKNNLDNPLDMTAYQTQIVVALSRHLETEIDPEVRKYGTILLRNATSNCSEEEQEYGIEMICKFFTLHGPGRSLPTTESLQLSPIPKKTKLKVEMGQEESPTWLSESNSTKFAADKDFVDSTFLKNFETFLDNNPDMESISFAQCVFEEEYFNKLCKLIISKMENKKIDLLAITDSKTLDTSQSKSLIYLLKLVRVKKLNLHGCNLERFIVDVLKARNNGLFTTEVLYGYNTVECPVKPNSEDMLRYIGSDGCSVFIPANAVDNEVKMSFTVVNELHHVAENLVQVTPVIQCQPSELVLKKPIALKFSTWSNLQHDYRSVAIFTRKSVDASWEKGNIVKCKKGDPVLYETKFLYKEVVGFGSTADETYLDYQVFVFKKLSPTPTDDQIVGVHCVPRNSDWIQDMGVQNNLMGFVSCLFPISLSNIRPKQVISTKITCDKCEVETPSKSFKCGEDSGEFNHSTAMICKGSEAEMIEGVRVVFTCEVDGVVKDSQSFKIHWRDESLNNSHLAIIKNQTNIQGGTIGTICDEQVVGNTQ